MKKQPFVVGDTAYHPGLGKVKIYSIERDGGDIQVREAEDTVPQWTNASLLSFEPWPAPVHERTMQDGYYLVRYKDYKRTYLAHYNLRELYAWKFVLEPGRKVETPDIIMQEDKVVPLSYLGTELKWWQS